MSWRLCDWLQDSPGYLVPGYAIQRGQNKRFLSLCVWEDALANLNLLVKNPYKSDNWQAVKYLVWSDRSNWNDPYWGKMLVWPQTARQIAHQPFSNWVWIPYSWHIELVIQNLKKKCTLEKKIPWTYIYSDFINSDFLCSKFSNKLELIK